MLVSIHKNKDGKLLGSLVKLPKKSRDDVRAWLSVSGEQAVIMDTAKARNSTTVEIRPGVLCEAIATHSAEKGALGKLYLDGDTVKVSPISVGDEHYAMPSRIVELLIKDNVFSDKKSNDTSLYTVAGLPQITLSSSKVLCESLMRRKLPRYGKLKNAENVEEAHDVKYGYIKVINNNIHIRKLDAPNLYQEDCARLSFFDTSFNNLMSHVLRGKWHYHDTTTKVIEGNKSIVRKYPLGEATDVPTLFNNNWKLRYDRTEIQSYLYPPHELREYGFPKDQKGLDNYYPIAGTSKDSIIIELFPGRIIEIPRQSLYTAKKSFSLGTLRTEDLGVGDMVKLSTYATSAGQPLKINLQDIKYGMRSLITKRAFLPIQETESSGSITLGGGLFSLIYPVRPNSQQKRDLVYYLDEENRLTPKTDRIIPNVGDVVMLKYDRQSERVFACGFEIQNIRFSMNDSNWGDAIWLKEQLNQKSKLADIFTLFHGFIPVVVESSNEETLCVFYPQLTPPSEGEIISCKIIGANHGYLFLRSGVRISRVEASKVFNVPKYMYKTFAKSLCNVNTNIWLRKVSDRCLSGLKKNEGSSRYVKIITSVNEGNVKGFICLDTENLEILWLPLERACRAIGALPEDVMQLITKGKKDGEIKVNFNNSCLSYIDTDDALVRGFEALKNGKEKGIKVVIRKRINTGSENSKYAYLCEQRPRGNIYRLESEKEYYIDGKIIDVFCAEIKGESAILMPSDERRICIALSYQALECLRKSYLSDKEEKATLTNNKRQNDGTKIPRRIKIERFRLKFEELSNSSVSTITCADSPDITESLFAYAIRVCEMIEENTSSADPAFQELMTRSQENAKHWISKNENTMPLFVALSIVIILSASSNNEDTALLLDTLSSKSIIFACEEYLLDHWLLSNYSGGNLRMNLLNTLSLGGEDIVGAKNSTYNGRLRKAQAERLNMVCGMVLSRLRVKYIHTDAGVAMCLLYLTKQLDKKYFVELYEILKDTRCYKLKDIKNWGTMPISTQKELLLNSINLPLKHLSISCSEELKNSLKAALSKKS